MISAAQGAWLGDQVWLWSSFPCASNSGIDRCRNYDCVLVHFVWFWVFFCRSSLTLLLLLSRFSGKENELMLFSILSSLGEALEPCINLERRKCFRRLHLLRVPKIAVNFLGKEEHSYSTSLLSMV